MCTLRDVKSAEEASAASASEGDPVLPNDLLSSVDDWSSAIIPILRLHNTDTVVITVEQCDGVDAAIHDRADDDGTMLTCARVEPAPKKQRISTAYTQCWLGEGAVGRDASWVNGLGQLPVHIPAMSSHHDGGANIMTDVTSAEACVPEIVRSLLPAVWVGSRPQFVLEALASSGTGLASTASAVSSVSASQAGVASQESETSVVHEGASSVSHDPKSLRGVLAAANAVAGLGLDPSSSLEHLKDTIHAYFRDHPQADILSPWLFTLITFLIGHAKSASSESLPVPDTMTPFVNIAKRLHSAVVTREARVLHAVSNHFADLRTQLASSALDSELRSLNEVVVQTL
jgi:hypothetical protein